MTGGMPLVRRAVAELLVTGAALIALILALQPVSASFNPVVTLVERALGLVTTRVVLALVPAQLAGHERRDEDVQPDTDARADAGDAARLRGRNLTQNDKRGGMTPAPRCG